MTNIRNGATAGAVGTLSLNIATYVDIALTGRAESSTPSESVRRLAERIGIAKFAIADDAASPALRRRRAALGAVLGFGVGVGAAYGALRPLVRAVPFPLAAIATGAAAMAAADVPLARLGISDPSTWSAADWARDAVPHLVYGAATVAVFDMLDAA